MTFNEFVKRFSTEEQCRDYLFQLRWPDGFECPHCKGKEYRIISDKLYWCVECKYQVPVAAGTIFQDTRNPLKAWFTAIWWITTQRYGASAEGLQQVLGMGSYKTAWTWLHKIRKAMVRADRPKLSGVIEVDEAYIGGEEHSANTGRGSGNKALVAIAVELKETEKRTKKGLRRLGRVRLSIVPDTTKKSLQSFVTDNIEIGSEVITDGGAGYTSLNKQGYKHTVYVQSKKKADELILPHAHLLILLLKRWLLGTHQGAVSNQHMQAYLGEYTFRFNRRDSAKRGLLFHRLLEGAVNCDPITYDDLVNFPSSPD